MIEEIPEVVAGDPNQVVADEDVVVPVLGYEHHHLRRRPGQLRSASVQVGHCRVGEPVAHALVPVLGAPVERVLDGLVGGQGPQDVGWQVNDADGLLAGHVVVAPLTFSERCVAEPRGGDAGPEPLLEGLVELSLVLPGVDLVQPLVGDVDHGRGQGEDERGRQGTAEVAVVLPSDVIPKPGDEAVGAQRHLLRVEGGLGHEADLSALSPSRRAVMPSRSSLSGPKKMTG